MSVSKHSIQNSNNKISYTQSSYEANTVEYYNEDNTKDEIIKNILLTKIELDAMRQNYEFAESDLIDYYLYQIKANQAKLDYLIKSAKSHKVCLNTIEKMNYDSSI